MNFFEHQANARRQTGRLVFMFAMALVLTFMCFNFFVGLFFLEPEKGFSSLLWHKGSLWVLLLVGLIIVGGSLVEALLLDGGGRALARRVKARRIRFFTANWRERQFINVVAEMSVAAGVPSPLLYVMDDEQGINAFVAGRQLDDTVMVVTAGALHTLSRAELQAVVGHEFSHILNGDMQLNFRLMILVAGLLAIGQVGLFLGVVLSRGPGLMGVVIAILGGVIWCIGAIGVFFSRLIKAAIARQREFLADASSVQFTRNPDGLAFALLKIKAEVSRSWLGNVRAESLSHMGFGETLKLAYLYATHPPLDDRIRALGSHYLAMSPACESPQGQGDMQNGLLRASAAALRAPAASLHEALPAEALSVSPAVVLAHAGTVSPAELESAAALNESLPAGIRQALYSGDGVQALIYALVIQQSTVPAKTLELFLQEQLSGVAVRIRSLSDSLEGMAICFALPLVELALPRLRLLSSTRQKLFCEKLQALVKLDQQLDAFDFAVLMLLRKQLHADSKPRPVRLVQCVPLLAALVTKLLRTGGVAEEHLESTLQRLMCAIATEPPALPTEEQTRYSLLSVGMRVLSGLSVSDKKTVLELVAAAVLSDAQIRLEEYELLRVIAAFLDCPMPRLAA